LTFPDFNSRFERIRYGSFIVLFPSIAIIAVTGLYLNVLNAEHDFDRTEMIIGIINNTHIGMENIMIQNCEQDAQINAILGFSVDEIKQELGNCLISIPFLDPPDGVEIEINDKQGESEA